MKKGDKVQFNGTAGCPGFTVGKIYTVDSVGYAASNYAVIQDDEGREYVWSYGLKSCANDFTLVVQVAKGDRIIFKGSHGSRRYDGTSIGVAYEVIEVRTKDRHVDMHSAVYEGDDGTKYVWRYNADPQDFEVIPKVQAPQVRKGIYIKFLGADGFSRRYRDTTVGNVYEITQVAYRHDGQVSWAKYLDDEGDEVQWNIRFEDECDHFEVITSYDEPAHSSKDGMLTSPHTLEDLYSLAHVAVDIQDMEWATELKKQIQQLEGEHA